MRQAILAFTLIALGLVPAACVEKVDDSGEGPPPKVLEGCEDPSNWICSASGSQCLARCGEEIAILCSGETCKAGYGSSYTTCGAAPDLEGCEICRDAINGVCDDLVDP